MRGSPLRRTLLGAFAAALLAASAGGSAWYLLHRPVAPLEGIEEALPLPPESPRLLESPEYASCLDQLREDPASALAFAEGWQGRGGGEGARHCQALAMAAMGEPERAAPRLEALAAQSAAGPAARAAVYDQAAQAWMAAGQPQRAYAAVTLGLAITPNDPDLLVDRSVAAGALGRFTEALADASQATEIDPDRPDAWVYRAAALRHLDRAQEALRDIERALALDGDNAEALLERGILRQLNGDLEGARLDWTRAMEVAPDSAAADLAQQNLELSEAGPTRR
ncbi:tetratricopeptide repeat protein [Roseomonas sp. OT10]|uniref:tetratricopeptide repeat protein n=1 Tax=Roseomonas cutis TaxID=2897332 RepID=UPI001E3E00F4|nr:tetratricopeptide repeat protein [Roseomonas sp. OT10]UFN47385.1 tetratricopeptide repeat protein [Roseomonas sp. OT10]